MRGVGVWCFWLVVILIEGRIVWLFIYKTFCWNLVMGLCKKSYPDTLCQDHSACVIRVLRRWCIIFQRFFRRPMGEEGLLNPGYFIEPLATDIKVSALALAGPSPPPMHEASQIL